MKAKIVSATAIALMGGALLALATATATAGEIHRSSSFTGPRGGSVSRSGSCATGAGCSRSRTVTAPTGNTRTSEHSAYANGHDGLNRTATYSGPRRTVSRSVHTNRYPRW
jgi:hypothetical protein